MPPTIALAGMSFVTTALASTSTLSPMVILPYALLPILNDTLFPITGLFSGISTAPMITPD